MKIQLNNKPHILPEESTLITLLESLNREQVGIAFAVDNKVIKRSEWNSFKLSDGMKVTMIKAVCGG